jgi:formylglycine-generating enzyme required for sulfatase activity
MPIRAPTETGLKAACLKNGFCTAAVLDNAAAVRRDLAQRGQALDIVDVLVQQGALTEEDARIVRETAASDAAREKEPVTTTAEVVPVDAQATVVLPPREPETRTAETGPPRAEAPAPAVAAATMDFSPDDLETALRRSQRAEPVTVEADASASDSGGTKAAVSDGFSVLPPAPPPVEEKPFGHDLVGRVLGNCRLERELGRGAMGVVFEATHLSLLRRVAVKVLMPSARKDKADVDQFVQEARAMARIEHQNIVQVHDVGEEDGLNFLVMQLLDGATVAARLEREHVLTWEEACRIARDAAKGLAVAHEKGIIHRDIKPENLMLTQDGVVKIADFGLAAQAVRGADDSQRTEVMGTPAYMSPEQIDGRNVDGRADVYSLGCTFYAMLTGRRPFEGDNAIEVLLKQTKDVATPVQKLVPTVPPSVSQVVEKCMAKLPTARYQTAADLVADLDKILSGGRPKIVLEIEDVMARMQEIARGDSGAAARPARRPVVVVSAAVVLVCVTAVGMMLALPDVNSAAADAVLQLPMQELSAELVQGRQALEAADAFAAKYPDRIDLVLRRYDEVAQRHGEVLGAELVAAREKAQIEFDKRCATGFANVRAKYEELTKNGDAVAAAQVLFSFPAEQRKGKPGEEWNGEIGRALNQVRSSTGMAYVPAGRLNAGADGAGKDVAEFLIDLTEVSNADYAAFVHEKSARAPAHWGGAEPPVPIREHPVVGITPAEAAAYAAWKGKRLPTALEWERAARGDDNFLYPWGNDFDAGRCVTRAAPKHELVPVRTFPGGRSPFGALNMAGNAAEWVSESSSDPLVGVGHEVRGGSAKNHPSDCSTIARYFLPEDTTAPELLVGFRCAKDVK